MRILLIEDDDMIGSGLVKALEKSAFSVDWMRDGISGHEAIVQGGYVLVLLDIGLPRRTGFEILKAVRQAGDRTPVIILTARDAVEDRIQGLDLGADDYVIKPFEVNELRARVRAAMRRRDGHAQLTIGTEAVQLDLTTCEATYCGATTRLSAREFALLHALLERPGAILSREQLEHRIYGWNELVGSNAVEVIIHGLRKRMGKNVIRNIRGLGWFVSRE